MSFSQIFYVSITVMLIFFASSSPVIAQEPRVLSLNELGIVSNFVLGFDSNNDIVSAIEATSTSIYIGGTVNYDISVEAPNSRRIITTCIESSPSFVYGDYADTVSNCGDDAIISKLDFDGTIQWSTFLGGGESDNVKAMTVDGEDNLIVAGTSNSPSFPMVNAYDTTVDEVGDVFLTKFQPNGLIEWSTFLGGGYIEGVYDILTDSQDNIILLGMTKSDDFPILNPFDGEIEDKSSILRMDSFISKFDNNGNLIWSSYLGGSELDSAYATTLDDNDNIIIAGVTRSLDFPVLNAPDLQHNGLIDVYLSKISPEGELVSSGYLGGQYLDKIKDMAINDNNEIIIVGQTNSENFPIIDAADTTLNSNSENTVFSDTLVVKFTFDGVIVWSTYLGGDGTDGGKSLNLIGDKVLVLGQTQSMDYPQIGFEVPSMLNYGFIYENGDQPSDIAISIYNDDGFIGHSMFYGGPGVERMIASAMSENLFIVGETNSGGSFPVTNATSTFPPGSYFLSQYEVSSDLDLQDKPEGQTGSQIFDQNTSADVGLFESFDIFSYLTLGTIAIIPLISSFIKRWQRNRVEKKSADRKKINYYLDKLRDY